MALKNYFENVFVIWQSRKVNRFKEDQAQVKCADIVLTQVIQLKKSFQKLMYN